MHELTLAENLRELLEEEARREGFQRVVLVRLEIGKLSCVSPEAMAFCFEEAVRGSVAEGARLEVVEAAGEGWCPECRQSQRLEVFEPVCLSCGGLLEIVRGQGVRLLEIEVV